MEKEWAKEIPAWSKCKSTPESLCPEEWGPPIEQLSCDVVFKGVKEGDDLTEDYYLRAYPVIEKQLAMAAVRLAALLNEALA